MIGLSSAFARARASSPQGYQSTGLNWCWRRVWLGCRARRLGVRAAGSVIRSRAPVEGQRCDLRREGLAGGGDLDPGARLPVLAAQVAEGDAAPEGRRDDGAGDPPHVLALHP